MCIDPMLVPTWQPFETTNEIIGSLQSHPDGQTCARPSPSWTYLVVPTFQKGPKHAPNN